MDQGVRRLKDLKDMTGLGSCCGKCVPEARRVLTDALARRNAMSHYLPVAAAA